MTVGVFLFALPFELYILIYIYIYIHIYIYLVQGKGSNPLKVLIKENKVIYQKHKSAKFGLVSYCH